MIGKQKADKIKEQEEKMKALRRELEEKITQQLSTVILSEAKNPGILRSAQDDNKEEKIRVEVQKINEGEPLEPEKAKRVIEALLFASSKPLLPAEIKKVIKSLTPSEIQGIVVELKAEYEQGGRSFEILEIAGGWELATKKEYAPWIFKIEMEKKVKQVTQSALETLAILAYKQPATRAEIEGLRGVDVSGVLLTLVERGLAKIVGRKEVPGRPFLYGTTDKFLEHFGLKSLEELPNIEEIKSLVEKSVKKEDLIGRVHVVENTPEPQAQEEAADDLEAEFEPEDSNEAAANPQEN